MFTKVTVSRQLSKVIHKSSNIPLKIYQTSIKNDIKTQMGTSTDCQLICVPKMPPKIKPKSQILLQNRNIRYLQFFRAEGRRRCRACVEYW